MNEPRLTLEDWLKLIRARIPLERKYALCAAPPGAPRGGAGIAPDAELERAVEGDLAWLQGAHRSLVPLTDPGYPERLKQIQNPPLALFVHGDAEALGRWQLAIVGSRSPTEGGRETARSFAGGLVEMGFAVTSGLARGIDGCAHEGALDGGGVTVAVSATGPDRVYPRSNSNLAARIVERGGAVVTEFPVGEAPLARNFPRRNRIISGLALGTLVVEAARKSGSLLTAQHAAEQGREVFAIPGSIHSPLARGCHRLIRQGAKLVECLDDIVEEFPWLGAAPAAADSAPRADPSPAPGDDASRVLDAMGYDPVDVDRLIARTGLPAEGVSTSLLELELRGLVCKSNGFFTRRAARVAGRG